MWVVAKDLFGRFDSSKSSHHHLHHVSLTHQQSDHDENWLYQRFTPKTNVFAFMQFVDDLSARLEFNDSITISQLIQSLREPEKLSFGHRSKEWKTSSSIWWNAIHYSSLAWGKRVAVEIRCIFAWTHQKRELVSCSIALFHCQTSAFTDPSVVTFVILNIYNMYSTSTRHVTKFLRSLTT